MRIFSDSGKTGRSDGKASAGFLPVPSQLYCLFSRGERKTEKFLSVKRWDGNYDQQGICEADQRRLAFMVRTIVISAQDGKSIGKSAGEKEKRIRRIIFSFKKNNAIMNSISDISVWYRDRADAVFMGNISVFYGDK